MQLQASLRVSMQSQASLSWSPKYKYKYKIHAITGKPPDKDNDDNKLKENV